MPRARVVRSVPIVRSGRVLQLEGLFDVPPAERDERTWTVDLPIGDGEWTGAPWSIGLIVGPSGSGKTTVARELFGDRLVTGHDWPADRCILDAFPPHMGVKEITTLLGAAGLSSVPSWLRPFRVLSGGEQFRATLARALAEAAPAHAGGKPAAVAASCDGDDGADLVVLDEFTSVVDRTVARIGSAAVAKCVRRSGRRLVAVTCHYDVIDWLDPDWVHEPADDRFSRRSVRSRPPLELRVRRCRASLWGRFGRHHYLTGTLNRSARCFTALVEGQPAAFTAVLPFPHPTRPGWREHRTVCLPDFQGVGIGNALSDFVAGLYRATGRPYRSVTSSPAMVRRRARSPHWRLTRAPSLGGRQRMPGLSRTAAADRYTASFEYLGPARRTEAAEFGVV